MRLNRTFASFSAGLAAGWIGAIALAMTYTAVYAEREIIRVQQVCPACSQEKHSLPTLPSFREERPARHLAV